LISQLIVSFESGITPSDLPGFQRVSDKTKSRNLSLGKSLGNNTYTVVLSNPLPVNEVEQVALELETSPQVISASPDLLIKLSDTVLTNQFAPIITSEQQVANGLWGLDRIDQAALPLDNVYKFDSTGKGIPAYIVDTGIKPHNEFGNRLAPGFSAIDDNRGTVDCNGHGSHVAGILGGETTGVAKEVTLIPVRVFGCTQSTSTSNIILGINWIIDHHPSGPGVVNMSLGGTYDEALDTAVTRLINAGLTVVVASGNDSSDACDSSPASTLGTITVNSLDTNDHDSDFSNYGPCTDIYAPGRNIRSVGISSETSYATMSGTSMATPFVAGAVARLFQENPEFNRIQVIQKLLDNATSCSPQTPFCISGISGDATKKLFTPIVDPEIVAQNAAAERIRLAAIQAAADAEAARIAEAARLAAEKAAADAEAARVAAEKAASDKAAADADAESARVAAKKAAALSAMSKSLKVKVLTKQRISILVTAPAGSRTIVQQKVGRIWKTVTSTSAIKSRVLKVSKLGYYRVQITSPNGTATSSIVRVK
jgi:subtilisin family serine protease